MNLDSFARFFVRFNGLCFLFWGLHDLISFPIYYSDFSSVNEGLFTDSFFGRQFYAYISQVAFQFLGAAFLLLKTNKVITLVLTGQWRVPKKTTEAEIKST